MRFEEYRPEGMWEGEEQTDGGWGNFIWGGAYQAKPSYQLYRSGRKAKKASEAAQTAGEKSLEHKPCGGFPLPLSPSGLYSQQVEKTEKRRIQLFAARGQARRVRTKRVGIREVDVQRRATLALKV